MKRQPTLVVRSVPCAYREPHAGSGKRVMAPINGDILSLANAMPLLARAWQVPWRLLR